VPGTRIYGTFLQKKYSKKRGEAQEKTTYGSNGGKKVTGVDEDFGDAADTDKGLCLGTPSEWWTAAK
jgi:hypothetical protein